MPAWTTDAECWWWLVEFTNNKSGTICRDGEKPAYPHTAKDFFPSFQSKSDRYFSSYCWWHIDLLQSDIDRQQWNGLTNIVRPSGVNIQWKTTLLIRSLPQCCVELEIFFPLLAYFLQLTTDIQNEFVFFFHQQ